MMGFYDAGAGWIKEFSPWRKAANAGQSPLCLYSKNQVTYDKTSFAGLPDWQAVDAIWLPYGEKQDTVWGILTGTTEKGTYVFESKLPEGEFPQKVAIGYSEDLACAGVFTQIEREVFFSPGYILRRYARIPQLKALYFQADPDHFEPSRSDYEMEPLIPDGALVTPRKDGGWDTAVLWKTMENKACGWEMLSRDWKNKTDIKELMGWHRTCIGETNRFRIEEKKVARKFYEHQLAAEIETSFRGSEWPNIILSALG
jgi:hypothetical protein